MIHKRLFPEHVKPLVERLYRHDDVTFRHSMRVGMLTQCLTLALGCSEQQANEYRVAGFLHDVGKLRIDASVLKKPGSLSDNEWTTIQQHPTFGISVLDEYGIKNQLYRDAVLYHHERMDGSGYPMHIKGPNIPLIAQIIGVIDSFDAMTQARPYSNTRSDVEALFELIHNKGKYNGEIVNLLVSEFELEPAYI